jgi:hypothetical protein
MRRLDDDTQAQASEDPSLWGLEHLRQPGDEVSNGDVDERMRWLLELRAAQSEDPIDIAPPTTQERQWMTFPVWVRAREPEFFADALNTNGRLRNIAKRQFARKLAAYSEAWGTDEIRVAVPSPSQLVLAK